MLNIFLAIADRSSGLNGLGKTATLVSSLRVRGMSKLPVMTRMGMSHDMALISLMHSIPQYETPEVLDNGDIIIRRKHPEPSPPKRPSPGHDETTT